MSLSGNDVLEGSPENGLMSKREKKKFEQVLRQIAASEVDFIDYHRVLILRATRKEEIQQKERSILKLES